MESELGGPAGAGGPGAGDGSPGRRTKSSSPRISSMRRIVMDTRRHQRSGAGLVRLPSLVRKVRQAFLMGTPAHACRTVVVCPPPFAAAAYILWGAKGASQLYLLDSPLCGQGAGVLARACADGGGSAWAPIQTPRPAPLPRPRWSSPGTQRSKSSWAGGSAGSGVHHQRRSRSSLHGIVAAISAAREATANHAAVEALAQARKLRRLSKVSDGPVAAPCRRRHRSLVHAFPVPAPLP